MHSLVFLECGPVYKQVFYHRIAAAISTCLGLQSSPVAPSSKRVVIFAVALFCLEGKIRKIGCRECRLGGSWTLVENRHNGGLAFSC